MSYTPYNAPLLSPLLGDQEIAILFGVNAELSEMIRFERALAKAQRALGMIPAKHEAEIEEILDSFEPDMGKMSAAVAKDGMAVPELVRQVRARLSAETKPSFHLHCTSQDVIDSCGMMKMRDGSEIIRDRLETVISQLEMLSASNGENTLMGFTRMQAALPVRAADRIDDWMFPLKNAIKECSGQSFPVQLGGPVGRSDAYDGRAKELAAFMAKELELAAPDRSWQPNRSIIVDIGNVLSKVSGHLGKIGADVALMAQMGEDHIQLTGGGGSSAMPHKSNPVLAESLMSIARFNAGLASTLHGCLVHEQERSGSAWAVEWMILPQLFVSTGAALRNAGTLVGMIERVGRPD